MKINAAEYYEKNAHAYQDQIRDQGLGNFHPLSGIYYEAFKAAPSIGVSVLDVGIGTGSASQLLLNDGFDVTGIDASPNMLKLAVQNGFDEKKTILADISEKGLPFPDNAFSITLTASSIAYLSNAAFIASEMLRVTKTGGMVLLDPGLHKYKKRNIIETINREFSHVPPTYIQNTDSFDKACRKAGGTLKKILANDLHIAETASGPIQYKKSILAFTKK